MKPESLRVPVTEETSLHVRHWPGERLPYLLVHGLSSNARLWDGVAERLTGAGHAVFAVDLRSHGESDRPADGYDTATAASDLDAVCAGLDLPAAVVAGQSWGGNVAVQLAARFPDRVRALALVDGGWIDLRSSFDSWEACAERLRPPELNGVTADEMRRRIARGHPDWAPWAVEATLANMRVESDGRVTRRLPVPLHMRLLRSMWDDPPQPYYPRVAVPVLLIPAGRKAPPSTDGLREARVRAYPGSDHDIHAQHPESLADDLRGLAHE